MLRSRARHHQLLALHSQKTSRPRQDFTTDSTAGVQAALNAAAGKQLYAPAGTYLMAGDTTIPSNVTLYGDKITDAMRGFLQEHGLPIARGAQTAVATVPRLLEDAETPIPGRLRRVLAHLVEEVRDLDDRIETIEHELAAIAKDDAVVQRLMRIPGIGLLTATALVATVATFTRFGRPGALPVGSA